VPEEGSVRCEAHEIHAGGDRWRSFINVRQHLRAAINAVEDQTRRRSGIPTTGLQESCSVASTTGDNTPVRCLGSDGSERIHMTRAQREGLFMMLISMIMILIVALTSSRQGLLSLDAAILFSSMSVFFAGMFLLWKG
jgi:hypothetical protein